MKKYNFFRKIQYSINSNSFFTEIIHEKLHKSILYLFFLTFLLSIPYAILVPIQIDHLVVDIIESESFPQFELNNNRFDLMEEDPFVFSDVNYILILDDSNTYTLNDLAGYTMGYLVTSEEIVISQSGTQPMVIPFENFQLESFSSEQFIQVIENLRSDIFAFFLILTLLVSILLVVSGVLLISLFCSITKNSLGLKLTYKQALQISIYSSTLPIIVVQLLKAIPFVITPILPMLIFFVTSIIYVRKALQQILLTHINNQAQEKNE